jgi:hypothetical protein
MAKRTTAKGQTELIDYAEIAQRDLRAEDAAYIADLRAALRRAQTTIEAFCLASDWLEGGEDTEAVHDNAHLARNPTGILAEIGAVLDARPE